MKVFDAYPDDWTRSFPRRMRHR